MNIHEYQAKDLLKKHGLEKYISKGIEAFTVQEAIDNAKKLSEEGANLFVVKAQIHAGGRGKAGGVKLAKNIDEVKKYSEEILGKTLVTHQTGPEGQKVRRLYIESGSDIEKEYYLSLIVDRSSKSVIFIASTEGGMDIEEVAEKNPEKIIKVKVDISQGISAFHARKLAFSLGFKGDNFKNFCKLAIKLYNIFLKTDASQLEINPLITTKDGRIVILDAKYNIDDNALYRQKEILEYRDEDEEDPLEIRASNSSLNYVKMDGDIGCMVNGAGLAMATMDIIKLYGSSPANFLDVGGGATKERVTEAFKIILSDNNVKAILVNIFGGIMRCDIIASGIIEAAKEISLSIPLIVRLEGTNVEIGKELLAQSDLNIISADNLGDAAKKAVNSIK